MIHDHYCYKAFTHPPGDDRDRVRREADDQFARICNELGAWAVTEAAFHRSVRVGAWRSRNEPVAPDYMTQPAAFRDWILSR